MAGEHVRGGKEQGTHVFKVVGKQEIEQQAARDREDAFDEVLPSG